VSACGGSPECSSGVAQADCPSSPDRWDGSADLGSEDESNLREPTPLAAFIDLERVEYQDDDGPQESAAARLFYSFFPASEDARERPVFVFFNGGPGGSTTGVLHAFGTAPTVVATDPPRAEVISNPDSFDQLGNLLYIDTRNAGFSYSVADDPSDAAQRLEGVSDSALNAWVDAADVVRVIVRVLEQQPALRNNRVVLVGESYGGSRAALVTALLFSPRRLAGSGSDPLIPYTDPALAAELAEHFAEAFPGIPFERLDARVISRQFGAQVLIQPAFGLLASEIRFPAAALSDCSPGSPMSRAAEAQTASCPLPLGQYDVELLEKPNGFTEAAFGAAAASMLDPEGFRRRFLVSPLEVAGLPAEQRNGAFRFGDLTKATSTPALESTPWTDALGETPAWDRYYLQNWVENGGFGGRLTIQAMEGALPLFIRHLPWVRTLITDALFDLSFPSRDLLLVLDEWREARQLEVTADYDGTAGEDRPGWLELEFGDSFALADERRHVRVRMPAYEHSGHAVTLTEGAALMQDVRDFLSMSGAPSPR
jgi:Serine carboxypeptidase